VPWSHLLILTHCYFRSLCLVISTWPPFHANGCWTMQQHHALLVIRSFRSATLEMSVLRFGSSAFRERSMRACMHATCSMSASSPSCRTATVAESELHIVWRKARARSGNLAVWSRGPACSVLLMLHGTHVARSAERDAALCATGTCTCSRLSRQDCSPSTPHPGCMRAYKVWLTPQPYSARAGHVISASV
jgi:hypothetical protein